MARPSDVQPDTNAHHKISAAEWTFYVTWVIALVAEGFIIRGLQQLARFIAPQQYGMWVATGLFFIVLSVVSLVLYWRTLLLAPLHGPFLRLTNFSLQWRNPYKALGFVISTLVAAPTGIAIVLKSRCSQYGTRLILLSSAIFSLFWVPVFVQGFSVFTHLV